MTQLPLIPAAAMLSPDARRALRFMEQNRDGTVMIDPAGGSGVFPTASRNTAACRELADIGFARELPVDERVNPEWPEYEITEAGRAALERGRG